MAVRSGSSATWRRFAGSEPMDVDTGGHAPWRWRSTSWSARYPRLGAELFDDEGRMRHTWVLALDGARCAAWPRDKDTTDSTMVAELLVTRFYSGG